jgi:putative MATE family efflux protein
VLRKVGNVIEQGNSPVHTIFLLAWPIILEQIMLSMVQYVDTAMVGSLGAVATAAVSINQPPINLINGLFLACGVGFTAFTARAIGAEDYGYAHRVVCQSVLTVGALGLLTTGLIAVLSAYIPVWMGGGEDILPDAKAYLFIIACSMLFKASSVIFSAITRGAGDTRTPMKVNLMVNAINVVGNFLLIYPTRPLHVLGSVFTMPGAGMGVRGAAIATSLSIAFGGSFMLWVIFFRSGLMHSGPGRDFRPDRSILKPIFQISLPAAGERMAMSMGQVMVTTIISSLGTVSLAAHHLAITAESICFMPAFGLSSAATTLVGQSLGAKREDLADSLSLLCIKITVIFMSAMGVFLFFMSEILIGLFTNDPEVLRQGALCLKIVAFAQPFFGTAMSIVGVLRGAGDTKGPFIIILISMWAVRIGLAYVLVIVMGLGLWSMWICMLLDFVTRSILFAIRYRAGKWKHIMVHH